MLLLVSPAKDLDFQPLAQPLPVTQPDMLAQSQQLAEICKTLTPADLSSLMHTYFTRSFSIVCILFFLVFIFYV